MNRQECNRCKIKLPTEKFPTINGIISVECQICLNNPQKHIEQLKSNVIQQKVLAPTLKIPVPKIPVPTSKISSSKISSPKIPSPKIPSPKIPSPKIPSPKIPSPKISQSKIPSPIIHNNENNILMIKLQEMERRIINNDMINGLITKVDQLNIDVQNLTILCNEINAKMGEQNKNILDRINEINAETQIIGHETSNINVQRSPKIQRIIGDRQLFDENIFTEEFIQSLSDEMLEKYINNVSVIASKHKKNNNEEKYAIAQNNNTSLRAERKARK